MTVTVQQAILGRRSTRQFRPEAPTESHLETLSRAALASPSAMDRQPWQFHFLLDPAVITRVSEGALAAFRAQGNQAVLDRIAARGATSLFYGAPLVVVISTPKDAPSLLDVGIAAQNLALSAQGLGLGSCIIAMAGMAFSGPDAVGCRQAMGLADDRDFALCVAIGHPAVTKEAHESRSEKITWVR